MIITYKQILVNIDAILYIIDCQFSLTMILTYWKVSSKDGPDRTDIFRLRFCG